MGLPMTQIILLEPYSFLEKFKTNFFVTRAEQGLS